MKALSDVKYEFMGIRTITLDDVTTKMFAFSRKGVSTRNLELYDNVLYTHQNGKREHYFLNEDGEVECIHK